MNNVYRNSYLHRRFSDNDKQVDRQQHQKPYTKGSSNKQEDQNAPAAINTPAYCILNPSKINKIAIIIKQGPKDSRTAAIKDESA